MRQPEVPVLQNLTSTFTRKFDSLSILAFQLENEIGNTIRTNLNETCTAGVECYLKTSAQCDDETESEYEEKTNIIKREVSNRTVEVIKQRKDRKKKRLKVGFELNAKLKNRTRVPSLEGLEKLQNVKLGSSEIGVVQIKIDTANIICPPGYVRRKMRCGMCGCDRFICCD